MIIFKEKYNKMTDMEELVKQFDNMRAFMMKVMEENKQLKYYCDAYEDTIKEAEFTIEELETKLSDKYKKIAELEKKVNRKAYEKKYKEQNKDKIKKQNKEYKEKNKEMIKSKGAEIVNCPCGKTHRYDNTRRHKMSKFHQEWLAGQSETQTSA